MDLHSKPIADITYADILAFLSAKHPESRILDYKSGWTDHLVRVMAAFANTDGGIMLIGVAEEDKTGCPLTPPRGVDIGSGEDAIKRRVESAAYDAVSPPLLPEVQVCRKDDEPSKAVVLVRVAESHQTPHWTDDRQRIYVRVQSQNRFSQRQAYPEELQWLLDRRRAATELRETLLTRARERAALIRAAHGPVASDQALIEAYAVPRFPDRPRVDLGELLEFARKSSAAGKVARSAYNAFPVSSRTCRSVAGGVAVTCREESGIQQCIQIDESGLLHSHLYIDPDTRDEHPLLCVSWLVAPVDAFLRYLALLCASFRSLSPKPVVLHASASLPPLSRIVWESRLWTQTRPLFDPQIELLEETCVPRELDGAIDQLIRECARRVLWAGGYPFASNEEHMDTAMQRLLTGRR